MRTLVQDLRYAMRSLLGAPGYLLAVVATLALGIGANAAVFSAISAALLPELPVPAPGELVNVYRDSGYRGIVGGFVSYPDYTDIRDRSDVFDGVLGFQYFLASVSARGSARIALVEAVTGNYCQVLGISPALGRCLQPDEEQAGAALAVISDRLWRGTFGADPDVLGRTLRVKSRPHTVIGVMAPAFRGIHQPSLFPTDVWLPLDQAPGLTSSGLRLDDRSEGLLLLKARLKGGVTLERAQAAMSHVAGVLDAAYPSAGRGDRRQFGLRPTASVRGNENMERFAMPIATGGMAAVGLILILACASIAHLLLARGSRRQAELAVRAALGAGRRRIVQLLLIESALLALAGGAGALGVARALIPLASWFQRPVRGAPFAVEPVLDGRVLVFTFLVSLATALVIGLVPAIRASKPDVARAFSGEGVLGPAGPVHRWSGRMLIVTETALSLVLVLVAALFARSFMGVERIETAFDTRHAAAIGVELGLHGFTEPQGRRFFEQLLAAARGFPGATSFSLTSALPVSGEVTEGSRSASVEREGVSLEEPRERSSGPAARLASVSPGYFRSIGLPITRGRDFSDFDGAGSPPVAVISETLARRFWPGANPVGARIAVHSYGSEPRSVEVVGVVRDTETAAIDPRGLRDHPWIYLSFAQQYASGAYLVARTDGNPDALLEPLRRLLYQVNPDVAPAEIATLRQLVRNRFYLVRAGAALMGAFALVGLALAIVGVYGVSAHVVSQRTREVGVRLALGASRGAILRLVLVEGLTGVGVGLATGVALALGAARVVSSMLFGIGAYDAVTFTAVPLLLLATACVACYVPARRASRLSPMTVLRRC